MKHFFGAITRLPSIIIVLLLTASALLACGPAAQAEPQGQPVSQAGQQDSEGTPVPAEEDGPKYPKLDAIFQQLVQQFEDGELSETQAAVQAPDHFDSNVMVTVDVDLSANLEAIDAWLSRQDLDYPPRLADPNATPLYINAWVPVSLLGALSQQDGVIIVSSTFKYRFHEGDPYKDGRPPISAPKPTPKYPAIDGYLQQDVVKFEEGQRAEGQAGGQAGDDVEDSVVTVKVYLTANTEAVAAWLRNNGGSPYQVDEFEGAYLQGYIEADMPLSLEVWPESHWPGFALREADVFKSYMAW